MGGSGKTLSACFMFRSSKVSLKQGRGCYREVEPRNLCKEFKKYLKILEINIENIGFRKKILKNTKFERKLKFRNMGEKWANIGKKYRRKCEKSLAISEKKVNLRISST